MRTDWLIIRRLAAELDKVVRSARVRDAGITADGRFALRIRARGAGGEALVIDAFAETPVVLLERTEDLEAVPGWPRAIADAISGMRIESVRSRTGDRLIVVELATLSRFGVLRSYRLVAELVPKFGNVLLLSDDVIVAAAREFSVQENARRPVEAGQRYVPPPLFEPTADPQGLEAALEHLADSADQKAIERAGAALRTCRPLLPTMVAASLVAELARTTSFATGREFADALLARAEPAIDGAAAADAAREVFVYRDDAARIVQVHVWPLHQFDRLVASSEPSILAPLALALETERDERTIGSVESKRASLTRRLRKRQAALEAERERLERDREDSAAADDLRRQGELLYAHLAEVPPRTVSFVAPEAPETVIALDPDLDPKANAAAIFRRYRKATAKKAHVERRLALNEAAATVATELAWELERADAAALEELADDVYQLDGSSSSRPGSKDAASPRRGQFRRGALEVPLAADARVLVGRSPRNNAELTFRLARPDDLWFHARGVPGAHVVLRIDSSRAATGAELQSAAELAAYHSKARTSGIVPVDYTARKHVRKQQNALPGLVWYTNAKTIDVTPKQMGADRRS